ncbi:Olfactory receptor 2G6 [Heterocephalus glaber]|uniref:Olfactory receptor 2G6 n=1 Tax=Heterocephalus glaber TaxID=10181 RepID=G5BEK0_HETGA|nr:Olfactory receptor 2G6 [Heterocephalus glaber]
MVRTKETSGTGFTLLGLCSHPKLQKALFVAFLVSYLLTILGNTAVIRVCHLDPKLHMPMSQPGDPMKSISYGGCVVQLYVSLALGSAECVLLAVTSYDRYVPVRHPLHYASVMHPQLCYILASVAWLSGMATTLVQSTLTLQLPLCGHHLIDHFICEVPMLIRLACMESIYNKAELFVASVLFLLLPVSFIPGSYSLLTQVVLCITLAAGRRKANGTCSPHLLVVVIFYRAIIFMYLQPARSHSKDQGKFISLFDTMMMPMLNPLIYPLRNKEVKGTSRKALENVLGVNFT